MKTTLRAIAVFFLAFTFVSYGQEQPKKPDQVDDTIRINTELVQTGVTVFDKQGRFVDGLKPEQFELRVDGKPQPISFFERVATGSIQEAKAQLTAETGLANPTNTNTSVTPQGRTIVFFLDDFHLSAASVEHVRKAILQFVDNEMGLNDQVLVGSATGQIGFLAQLTDNKAVLHAAVARLTYKQFQVRDNENIAMTEYQAIRISQGDRDAIGYYVTQLQQATNYKSSGGSYGPTPSGVGIVGDRVRQGNTGTADPSNQRWEAQVRRRAENIITQSMEITSNTLRSLENLMRESLQLSGRKVIFFVSDGFFLIDEKSGASSKLQQITDAAARAGVVIYSIDARGMTNFTDASSNRSDPIGQLSRSNAGELSASQGPLSALASDTGGRALFNSEAMNSAVTNALKETSSYYLLAWKPASEEQHGGKFKRLEVNVIGRPDLTVRLPRGYLEAAAVAEQARVDAKTKKQETSGKPEAAKSPTDIDLRTALLASTSRKGLGTLLSTSFIDTPNNGPVLMASTQVEAGGLGYGDDGKQIASLDMAGVVLNDQGKPVTGFKTRLNVKPLPTSAIPSGSDGVIYYYRAPLPPGLYQVRVAARDDKTGKVGSAMQWVEIPDLKSHHLILSSLLLSRHDAGANDKTGGTVASDQMQVSVDRRFPRTSRMNILSFIYNATQGSNGAPDLSGQIQVLRDGRAVLSSPQRQVVTSGLDDQGRIPFGGDLSLSTLPAGYYILQITVNDRIAQTTVTQRVGFEVQ
jgi:VWFA-related protein